MEKIHGGKACFKVASGVNKNAPFLTGFSTLLSGSSKRSKQALLNQQRSSLIASQLSDYALQFEPFIDPALLDSLSQTRRRQHYDNVTTFWAWLSQIIEQNASCSKAVSMVQTWCAQAGRPIPCSATGAYCQARQRLGLEFLQGTAQHILASMQRRITDKDRWRGLELKAIDGTSVKLMDTEANQLEYPQPSTQKTGCGFPVMGMVGVLNLSHGGWECFATAANDTNELTMTQELLDNFKSKQLVLADRGFCSYELIAQLLAGGTHSLMRLHQARHAALDWRKGKKLSPTERLVTWKKPRYRSGGRLSYEQWEALPETLSIRLVKYRCAARGLEGKQRDIVVATTLLDPLKYPAEEIASLYHQRWHIELKFRDMKTTLGMEDFAVKSPDMAHKTLWMVLIVSNLIKAVSQRAAQQSGRSIAQMSYKGVLDLVVSYRSNYNGHRSHEGKRRELHRELIEIASSKVVDDRPGRHEPRAVKKRPKPFSWLTAPRAVYVEIQHRSKYRKAA